jgi:hypothetical protein
MVRGTIAGFLSVAFSILTVAYFFVPPLYSWSIDTTAEPYFIAFIVSAATVSWGDPDIKRGLSGSISISEEKHHPGPQNNSCATQSSILRPASASINTLSNPFICFEWSFAALRLIPSWRYQWM